MKKLLIFIMSVFFLLTLNSAPVFAVNEFEDDISEKLFSGMDSEITELLSDFGITSLDYESIYNISLKSIILYYKDSVSEYFSKSVRLTSRVFAVLILAGALSIINDEKKYKDVLKALLIPIVTVMLTDEINLCISSALSLMKLNGSFMLTFVPVYAIAVAVSGSPAAALTYNSLVLGFAELISAIINFGLVDLLGCFFCVSIGFSVNPAVNFPRFLNAVNRITSFALGLISSVFGALLSIKGIFSSAADSVASKGIKFAIGSLIPVIGSSISDAYSTLLGSFGIIKNSVAIFGIIVIILINLPVVAEIMLFNFLLNFLSFVSELLDCKELSDALRAFAFGIKTIGLIAVFEALILIISTAIMLSFKGG